MNTTSGLDNLAATKFSLLNNSTVGIMANQASVNSQCQHIVDLAIESKACLVKKIFAPEHGFRGVLQDMETVNHSTDQKTGLPIISLYGADVESLTPTQEQLEDIDILLFDLQDIGTRFYTFAQTLAYCMRAAAKAKVKVVVIDRPNPINGLNLEGPQLLESCRSFCGLAPTPIRHGMTIGELAQLFRGGFEIAASRIAPIDCELEIIKMGNWNRANYYQETKLPWVPPSPNMPTIETAVVYPGACLFEATNLSEGRGTTKPFEYIGAPFIDSFEWIEAVKELGIGLEGAVLRSTSFVPHYSKHKHLKCSGIQIHVTDHNCFRSTRLALALIYTAQALYPKAFKWRHQAYEFVDKVPAIDLLYGSNTFRKAVENQSGLNKVLEEMNSFEETFKKARKEFLIYP